MCVFVQLMKMEIANWFIPFGSAIILVCAWKILDWVWFKPKRLENFLRRQGFSGNSYTLLHGDMKEITKAVKEAYSRPIGLHEDFLPRVLNYDLNIINKYGKNSFKWMGRTPSVNITDPELRMIMFSQYESFHKPKPNPLRDYLVNGMGLAEGYRWARIRKIEYPAFYTDKLKGMFHEMHTCCKDLVNKWNDAISNKESLEIDVCPDIQTMTRDVICRTAFSSSYEDGRKIFELLTKQISNLSKVMQKVYIPGWRYLPTPMNRKIKATHNEMKKLIKGIIDKKEQAMKNGEAKSDDLLGLLLESNHKEIEEKKAGITDEELMEECKQFYFAGQETTATLIIWTMIMLSIYPNWQERAREEVFQVFGKQEPKFEGLNQLKVIGNILYEVLRLFPPATILTRVPVEETKLGEMVIPAGVELSMPIILVHQDPEYWGDDAKDFNPDRFSEGISKASKKQLSYFPFGGGPRVCIGQNLSLVESKLAIAMILQNFSFQLSPTYVHAPMQVVTLIRTQYGAPLVLHKI